MERETPERVTEEGQVDDQSELVEIADSLDSQTEGVATMRRSFSTEEDDRRSTKRRKATLLDLQNKTRHVHVPPTMSSPPPTRRRVHGNNGMTSGQQRRTESSELTEEAQLLKESVDQVTCSVETLISTIDFLTGNAEQMLAEAVHLLVGSVDILKDSLNNLASRVSTFVGSMDSEPPSEFLSSPVQSEVTGAEEALIPKQVVVDLRENSGSRLAEDAPQRVKVAPPRNAISRVNTQRSVSRTRRTHFQVDFTSVGGRSPLNALDNFLKCPTPDKVTGLALLGVEPLVGKKFSRTEERLWNRFVAFWATKLETLEVDCFDNLLNPVDSRVNQLLCCPLVSRLRCPMTQFSDQSCLDESCEFPAKLFQLEHLSLRSFNLDSTRTQEFFSRLSRSQQLRSFEMKVTDFELLEVKKFIDLASDNVHLEIRLTMSSFHNISGFHQTASAKELFHEFVLSVVASSSVIRVRNVWDGILSAIQLEMDEEVSRKFFHCVEFIQHIEEFGVDNKQTRLLKFPNLKSLGGFQNSPGVRFPEGLRRLRVFKGIPDNLPTNLTHFETLNFPCTVGDLEKSLTSLDVSCPSLNTLSISWSPAFSVLSTSAGSVGTPFQSLRSLNFTLDAGCVLNYLSRDILNGVGSLRSILLNTMQLPHLQLLHLGIHSHCDDPSDQSSVNLPPLFDPASIRSLIGGSVANSLVSLEVDDVLVDEAARSLLKSLQSKKVAKNREERQKRLGAKWDAFLEKDGEEDDDFGL